MVEVIFYRDSRKRLFSLIGTGHVEVPQTTGGEYSLVCAAVSAVLQAARKGLEEYAGVPLEALQGKGDLRIRVPESRRDDEAVRAILRTAELAVGQIAKQYPQHVSTSSIQSA
ncbi:MAG: hypothetical protein NVS9B12_03070 [Vulcanimicrobiaceae bacterium]